MPVGRAVALVAGAAALGLLIAVPPAAAGVPVIAIDGRGWGHGVGMAQDGALEMGREGASLSQILGQFYPGVSLGHASGDVRVPVLVGPAGPGAATLTLPDGGEILDTRVGAQSPGFPVQVPAGGSAQLAWDGSRYSVTVTTPPSTASTPSTPSPTSTPTSTPSTTSTTTSTSTTVPRRSILPIIPTTRRPTTTTTEAPTTTTVAPRPTPAVTSTRPLWALPADGGVVGVPARGRSYRGAIEASGDGGALRLINQVDVETYLVGMGEVRDPSWPLASLEAQEVAARTYAMRAMATGGELCDDTRCQVYLGADAEYPAAQRAVAATAGEVMVSKGGLVDAVYSANAAGYSASRQEGFGVTDTGYPYLRAAPYPTKDPMPWTVQIATKDVVTRLGLHGDLTNVAVAGKGPSGRALEVTVTAGSTTQVVSGLAFAAALGLRSTMIDAIRAEIAAVAPPPPGASVIQVPPEDAAGVAAAIIPEVEIQALNGDVVQNAAMPDFGAGRLPIAHQADVPVGRVVLAIGLVALTGAGVFRSRPSRRRAYPRRRPSPPAYRR